MNRGFLSGRIKRFQDLAADDFCRYWPRPQKGNFAKNLVLVAPVEEIATAKGAGGVARGLFPDLH
jgi:hypothetical protein